MPLGLDGDMKASVLRNTGSLEKLLTRRHYRMRPAPRTGDAEPETRLVALSPHSLPLTPV